MKLQIVTNYSLDGTSGQTAFSIKDEDVTSECSDDPPSQWMDA